MNMFFGAYGKGGEVKMEVDYIRYYQWELEKGNETPNHGFEYHNDLFPWEGTGKVSSSAAHSGDYGAELSHNDSIYQYMYLDHSINYKRSFEAKGQGRMLVKVENITEVSGIIEDIFFDNI